MAMIRVMVALWAGSQNLSTRGYNGFDWVDVTPEDLPILGMDTVAHAVANFDHVDRVTVENATYREEWKRDADGNWHMM